MKKTILFIALTILTGTVFAQKKTTTSATASFDATTAKDPLPKADNNTVIGSLDTKTGAVAFEAAVKNFSFANPRMQQHFNSSSWLDSDQFPKITFTGTIEKVSKIKFNKDGTYPATVNGTLTIKGIAKPIKVKGTIVITGTSIKVDAKFIIKLADYSITGQPVEAGKVSKEPGVSISATF